MDNKLLSMNERLKRFISENKSLRLHVNEQQSVETMQRRTSDLENQLEARIQFKAISINLSEATIVAHLGRDRYESLKENFGMPFDEKAFVEANNQVYTRHVLDDAIKKMTSDPLKKLQRSLNSFVRLVDKRAVEIGNFQRPTEDLFVEIGYSYNSDEAPPTLLIL